MCVYCRVGVDAFSPEGGAGRKPQNQEGETSTNQDPKGEVFSFWRKKFMCQKQVLLRSVWVRRGSGGVIQG